MSNDPTWLTPEEFQNLACLKERAAREALAKCHASETATWRGVHLNVRMVAGVGGASGKTYQVDAISLPPELAQKHLEASRAVTKAPEIPVGHTVDAQPTPRKEPPCCSPTP